MTDDARQFENFVRQTEFDDAPDPNHRDALEKELLSALAKQAPRQIAIWRTIMKSQITKLATAAAIILIGVLSITFLNESVSPAYAIEQTIEAYQTVRYVNALNYYFDPSGKIEQSEIWIKFDENGELSAIWKKLDQNNYRAVIWEWDKSIRKIWEPDKKQFTISYTYDKRILEPESQVRMDPKFAMELLEQLEAEGRVWVDIEDSGKKDEPIRVIATQTDEFVKAKSTHWAHRRYVVLIDRHSRLAKQFELYVLLDDEFKLRSRIKFLGHYQNEPTEILISEPPAGAEIIDMTKDIGLAQGNMSGAETASEVVRQYIEALIAKDYDKAANLYNGTTPDGLCKSIEERSKIKFLRVVDIGRAITSIFQGQEVFLVPFEYEYEKDGVKDIEGPQKAFKETDPGPSEHRKAMVRPLPGHPDRWVITGGI